MHLGIADHYGWAVAVTATAEHVVADRRRIDLIEPGLPVAPVEHDAQGLDPGAATALVAAVRASAARVAAAALDELEVALPARLRSMSLRAWPADFPDDVATQLRAPFNARADSVMYRQVLAEVAETRGLAVHLYDAKGVERQAAALLGGRAEEILHGPRAALGPPWAKDHRTALAAAVLAASS